MCGRGGGKTDSHYCLIGIFLSIDGPLFALCCFGKHRAERSLWYVREQRVCLEWYQADIYHDNSTRSKSNQCLSSRKAASAKEGGATASQSNQGDQNPDRAYWDSDSLSKHPLVLPGLLTRYAPMELTFRTVRGKTQLPGFGKGPTRNQTEAGRDGMVTEENPEQQSR